MTFSRSLLFAPVLLIAACAKTPDYYVAPEDLPVASSSIASAKANWSRDGVECFKYYGQEQEVKAWEKKIDAMNLKPNHSYNLMSICTLPDGTQWLSGSESQLGDRNYFKVVMLHIGTGSTIVQEMPGYSNNVGDINICSIDAIKGNEMVVGCGGGDAGYGFVQLFVLNTKTGKKTEMYADVGTNALLDECTTNDDNECYPKGREDVDVLPGCFPPSREEAQKIQRALRKKLAPNLSVSAIGEYCPYGDRAMVPFVIAEPGPHGEERRVAVAVINNDKTEVFTIGEAHSAPEVPDQFMVPPHLVRITGKKYFFLSHSKQGSEFHRHFLRVDVGTWKVDWIFSSDLYRNHTACNTWGLCSENDEFTPNGA